MRSALLVRIPVVVCSLAITAGLTVEFGRTLNADAVITTRDVVLILLFTLCSFWIAFSFVLSSAGFLYTVFQRSLPGPLRPRPGPVRGRTAVVMTIYNEEPSRSLGNLAATIDSTRRTGELDAFDFFLLSDTTKPDVAAEEARAWYALCRRLGVTGKLFYRRRERNLGAKAGNVADFCRRWGGAYDYMVVLDADSVMDGRTLVSLARIMDANPRAGLVQTQTRCVGRASLFGRMLQFSGAVYGSVFAAGQALWQGRDGNYWGHNAIIRVSAFAASCGLPSLSGRPPLGGHILSHDFVEAAFLRRAGWEVWLVPDLGGSFEEAPPTLLDFAKRDQRWCQGNLSTSASWAQAACTA
ncbi:MAG: glucans biosynthesis glucosyltransferase MdoH [Bauldia litoralis]